MQLYADQKHDRLIFYVIIPLVMLFNVAYKLSTGSELTSVFVSSGFIVLIIFFGVLTMHKQSRKPLFEVTGDSLRVKRAWSPELEIPLDSITGIERSLVFGCKLMTLSGDIVIPLRSLSKEDREMFKTRLLQEIKSDSSA